MDSFPTYIYIYNIILIFMLSPDVRRVVVDEESEKAARKRGEG